MKRGQTLVASLIVLVIIAILAVVVFNGSLGAGKSTRKDGLGTTIPGKVKAAARDDVCRSNLNQVRMAIQIERSTADDAPPASLKDLRLSEEFLKCSIGQEPYEYDPETATVKCPHPGHEKY